MQVATIFQLHVEAATHLHVLVTAIRAAGAGVGVVLNPGTPVDAALEVLSELDLVLVMSVNPGFGGQSFILLLNKKYANSRSPLMNKLRLEGARFKFKSMEA